MSMTGYTKLFSSILASTIWRADDKMRLVWITLLAMADKRGIAEGSIPGIADFARVSLEDCEKALEALQLPDTYSRSKEYEGRRIEVVDGGWRLLNHGKYREKLSQDERKEYLKVKQREYRKRKHESTNVNNVSDMSTLVNIGQQPIKKEKKGIQRKERNPKASPSPTTKAEALEERTLSSADADFEVFRTAYPISRRVGGKLARSAFQQAMKGRDGNHIALMIAAVEQQKQSEQWQTPKLIPLMTTWLNQERWTQVLPPPRMTGLSSKTAGNQAALERFANRRRPQ